MFVVTFTGDTEEEKPLSHLLQSVNDYERSIFSGSPKTDSFFQKFDRIGKGRDSFGSNWTGGSRGGFPSGLDGIDESLSSLQDGIDGKLEKAATNFKFDNGVDGSSSRDRSLREGVNYGTMVLNASTCSYFANTILTLAFCFLTINTG